MEEDEKNNKINNLILDAEFFGDSNKLGNSLIFQYLNDSDTIKKAKMINCKIRSGKILSHFPFISKDVTPANMEEMKSKIFENSDREKKDILNLLPEYITKKKKEKEIHFSFNNHYYKYLDRKIDILGKVMISNLNKIILQIYLLKNNQNFNEKYQLNPLNSIDREEKDENDNNMTFIRSIRNNDFKSPGKERKESVNDKRNSSQNYTSYKKIKNIKLMSNNTEKNNTNMGFKANFFNTVTDKEKNDNSLKEVKKDLEIKVEIPHDKQVRYKYKLSDIFNLYNDSLYTNKSAEKYLFKHELPKKEKEENKFYTLSESNSDWIPNKINQKKMGTNSSVDYNIITPMYKGTNRFITAAELNKNNLYNENPNFRRIKSISEFIDLTRVSATNTLECFDRKNKLPNFKFKNMVATDQADEFYTNRNQIFR